MSFRFVILGLLVEQPLHGYAIQAALETRFDELCDPAFGDVYRILAALRRDGLVTVVVDRIGRRPRRKVHAPTAAGRRALLAWLQTGDDDPRTARDARWLRILIAASAAPGILPQILDGEVLRRRRALHELETLRPVARGAADFAALVRTLRHASALEDARAAVRMAELCRRVVRQHLDGAPVSAQLRALARPDATG